MLVLQSALIYCFYCVSILLFYWAHPPEDRKPIRIQKRAEGNDVVILTFHIMKGSRILILHFHLLASILVLRLSSHAEKKN